VAWR